MTCAETAKRSDAEGAWNRQLYEERMQMGFAEDVMERERAGVSKLRKRSELYNAALTFSGEIFLDGGNIPGNSQSARAASFANLRRLNFAPCHSLTSYDRHSSQRGGAVPHCSTFLVMIRMQRLQSRLER